MANREPTFKETLVFQVDLIERFAGVGGYAMAPYYFRLVESGIAQLRKGTPNGLDLDAMHARALAGVQRAFTTRIVENLEYLAATFSGIPSDRILQAAYAIAEDAALYLPETRLAEVERQVFGTVEAYIRQFPRGRLAMQGANALTLDRVFQMGAPERDLSGSISAQDTVVSRPTH